MLPIPAGERISHLEEASMGDLLIVQSKVREIIKKSKMNTSGDAIEALSKAVEDMVKAACKRAGANKRKTVQGRDV